jgi:histone acetyltransferase 1
VGEEETIFGYKGLNIQLRFAAHDLKSNIRISYDEKFRTVGDVEAVDLNKQWGEWVPGCMFQLSGCVHCFRANVIELQLPLRH